MLAADDVLEKLRSIQPFLLFTHETYPKFGYIRLWLSICGLWGNMQHFGGLRIRFSRMWTPKEPQGNREAVELVISCLGKSIHRQLWCSNFALTQRQSNKDAVHTEL